MQGCIVGVEATKGNRRARYHRNTGIMSASRQRREAVVRLRRRHLGSTRGSDVPCKSAEVSKDPTPAESAKQVPTLVNCPCPVANRLAKSFQRSETLLFSSYGILLRLLLKGCLCAVRQRALLFRCPERVRSRKQRRRRSPRPKRSGCSRETWNLMDPWPRQLACKSAKR